MKILNKLLIGFTFFLISCSNNLSIDNYNRIYNGMSISEVESILGKGKSQASSSFDLGEFGGKMTTEVMTWQSGMKVISITFSNGKVEGKAQTGL